LWDLAIHSIFGQSSQKSHDLGKSNYLKKVGLFNPQNHLDYCRAPATKKQKESASVAIKTFWGGLSEKEKSDRGLKASLEAAKKTRKKILLTYPDGSTKIFNSVKEAMLEAKVSPATIIKMRSKGVKSKGGFMAKDLNE
jgi:hypothetical protein